MLRPDNAAADSAADQIAVLDKAAEQLPREVIADPDCEILLRADAAGSALELCQAARDAKIGYLVGFDLTKQVRRAILSLPEAAWRPALHQDGGEREGAQVAEMTELLEFYDWPEGSRVIVRRERPHPGAQLTFTDLEGNRFHATLPTSPATRSRSSACAAHAPTPRTASGPPSRPAWRTSRSASSC
ncbi:MAG: hypothetical protein E6G34_00955 [Actinobacteria bacterium]|nr:MAG: hypothetical protein E6G34_00955 [Actinomycetota bacterium]